MKKKNHNIDSAEVLMLGITFKENCTDIRNSKAIDIVNELREFGAIVDVYDPLADKHEVEKEYSIILTDTIDKKNYKAIILAVAHDEFLNIDFSSIRSNNTVVFDVKSILPIENIDGRL
jgi:UDP-N-acetyl-D-galactosamine dehydrogenase